MNKSEKNRIKKILDKKVDTYFLFLNRDDFPERPCVRKNVAMLQNEVFTLADFLHQVQFITFEECCEYWAKVGFVDEFNEKCKFTECGANIDGVCEYTKRGNNNVTK